MLKIADGLSKAWRSATWTASIGPDVIEHVDTPSCQVGLWSAEQSRLDSRCCNGPHIHVIMLVKCTVQALIKPKYLT